MSVAQISNLKEYNAQKRPLKNIFEASTDTLYMFCANNKHDSNDGVPLNVALCYQEADGEVNWTIKSLAFKWHISDLKYCQQLISVGSLNPFFQS